MMFKRCCETGHKSERCPDQICNLHIRKRHGPNIGDSNVTALTLVDRSSCNDDSGTEFRIEDTGVFMCDASDKLSGLSSDESDEEDIPMMF